MWGFTVGVRALGVKSLGIFAFGSAAILGNAWLIADEPTTIATGRTLFMHEWTENDPLAHGGDGLGPMFNDTSCIACHIQGGVGGAGPVDKNAQIVSLAAKDPAARASQIKTAAEQRLTADQKLQQLKSMTIPRVDWIAKQREELLNVTTKENQLIEENDTLTRTLKKFHAGLTGSTSLVLHRSSTRDTYATIRKAFFEPALPALARDNPLFFADIKRKVSTQGLEAQILSLQKWSPTLGKRGTLKAEGNKEDFNYLITERNTPALFGAGLLDVIPDSVIQQAAKQHHLSYPEITGRARVVPGSKQLGRFGWKGEIESLERFVRNACAIELGLNVPDKTQALDATDASYTPPKLDLNRQEFASMVSFLKDLPKPIELGPPTPEERAHIAAGRKLFTSIGCAVCHVPNLGKVTGVYSDLLMHDMGPGLVDTGGDVIIIQGSYAGSTQTIIDDRLVIDTEWRTPPLWGVADSTPYMHDGRAKTLEQAIAWHDGEAVSVSRNYFKLEPQERTKLLAFLQTLRAPPSEGPFAPPLASK